MSSPRSKPKVVQWVLDTRELWPEAKETNQLAAACPSVWNLLNNAERQSVLKYYFVKDAKLALGSTLLKRLMVSTHVSSVSWDDVGISRDERTKPVFVMPDGTQPVLFNVSHQAGIVALLGVVDPPTVTSSGRASTAGAEAGSAGRSRGGGGFAVGVDVVCATERRTRDHQMIEAEGWPQFVDIHAEVFGTQETASLKAMERQNPGVERDVLLEYFYALWCLREAYVKMTGEALLAVWLKKLNMREFAPPGKRALKDDGSLASEWTGDDAAAAERPQRTGEGGSCVDLTLEGKSLTDVQMVLTPLLGEYMIGTSVRRAENGESVEIGEWEVIDIETIVKAAEKSRSRQA